MEELANPGAKASTASVRDGYLAEVVLLLMDRLDQVAERVFQPVIRLDPQIARQLTSLTQEDWDAFLAEYGQYVMDGWGELRAFHTALGTLLVQLEQKQKKAK